MLTPHVEVAAGGTGEGDFDVAGEFLSDALQAGGGDAQPEGGVEPASSPRARLAVPAGLGVEVHGAERGRDQGAVLGVVRGEECLTAGTDSVLD
jgi:hypothetical protein